MEPTLSSLPAQCWDGTTPGPFGAGGAGPALELLTQLLPFHHPCSSVLALELLEELSCANHLEPAVSQRGDCPTALGLACAAAPRMIPSGQDLGDMAGGAAELPPPCLL